MKVIATFLVPSTPHPGGGALGIVEFANGLARRGHEVHLVHLPFGGWRITDVGELDWCPLDPRITHHFQDEFADHDVPRSDFCFCFDGRVPSTGLPLTFLQAFQILPIDIESTILSPPGPLLCTSTWLRSIALDHGVPEHRALHLPYGIRHEKYRLTKPIAGRRPRIAMLYNSHPLKCAQVGIDALAAAKERVPEIEAVVFGTTGTIEPLPSWMEYVACPTQEALVDEVYNESKVFLSPAMAEGFGLAAVESMACGCALVTTANGGSGDYAVDGDTAFVTPPHDVASMADAIVAAVTNDDRCALVANRGRERALDFTWDHSADVLEGILLRYAAEPQRYQRG